MLPGGSAVYKTGRRDVFMGTLPETASSLDLFELAVKKNVAFVPGSAFYVDDGSRNNTLRLNFSNSEEEQIEEGIKRLAGCLERLLEKSNG